MVDQPGTAKKAYSGKANTVSHPSLYGERHAHRHQSKRSKRIRTLQIVNLLLALALVAVIIGWINARVEYQNAESMRFELAMDLRKSEAELETLRTRSAEMQADLNSLVNNRLPNLNPLELDQTLTVDAPYVRNITFRETGLGDRRQYEYSAVLENASREPVTPKIRLLLFDDLGIQTGSVTIAKEAATSNSDMEFLAPGEIRAYTDKIPTATTARPRYFLVLAD